MLISDETPGVLPALTFVAPSGTGKTTLLADVIERLVAQGLAVAVMKASHHDHDLDVEGKDSWRFQRAGAELVGLCGPARTTLFIGNGRETWPSLRECADWLARAPFASFDLMLCEGFASDASVSKLRVVRGPWTETEVQHSDLVAVAWDRVADEARPAGLPESVALLPLNAIAVAEWVVTNWMTSR